MHKKLLIADDHFAIRTGLRHILQLKYPALEIGEAVSAAETLKSLREADWDLLILDVEIPGMNGLDLLKQIISERIKTPVLVFSFYNEQEIAIRAFRAGAAGYLSKDCSASDLLNAIEHIWAGKKYVSAIVAQQMAQQIGSPSDREPHETLSDREYQILLLIASGRTVSEISDKLSLSVSTISTYRARILRKMGLRTNAELTNYVIRRHLQ